MFPTPKSANSRKRGREAFPIQLASSCLSLPRSHSQPFTGGQPIADLLAAGSSEQTVLELARMGQLGLWAGQAQAMRLAGLSRQSDFGRRAAQFAGLAGAFGSDARQDEKFRRKRRREFWIRPEGHHRAASLRVYRTTRTLWTLPGGSIRDTGARDVDRRFERICFRIAGACAKNPHWIIQIFRIGRAERRGAQESRSGGTRIVQAGHPVLRQPGTPLTLEKSPARKFKR